MSVIKRVASGTVASWVRIIVALLLQLALVPVFLAYWDASVYGVWLGVYALVGFFNIIDIAHQNYLGNVFLCLGSERRSEIRVVFFSSLPICVVIGFIQLLAVALLVCLGFHKVLLGLGGHEYEKLSDDAAWVLFLQILAWIISGSVGGIAVRLVVPFGYYAKMAWWGVLSVVITGVAPVIPVVCGLGLRGAGVALALSTLLYAVPFYFQIVYICRIEGLNFSSIDFKLAWANFFRSQLLALKSIFEMLRQQGSRVILAPLAGVSEMAAFSTMRTGANVALQGLGTIANPLAPELIRFLVQKNQMKSESMFAIIWLGVVGVLAPAVVILQFVAPVVFMHWTRGKIDFDPVLFGLLSISVIVYGLAQPAMTVIQGNNLLREQVVYSALAAIVVVSIMIWLVPAEGVLGAAIALLVGEIVSCICYVLSASKWLTANGMAWPWKTFFWVIGSAVISAFGLLIVAVMPKMAWGISISVIVVLVWILWRYWLSLPEMVHQRVAAVWGGFLPYKTRCG